jgi:hypothetical protein
MTAGQKENKMEKFLSNTAFESSALLLSGYGAQLVFCQPILKV